MHRRRAVQKRALEPFTQGNQRVESVKFERPPFHARQRGIRPVYRGVQGGAFGMGGLKGWSGLYRRALLWPCNS